MPNQINYATQYGQALAQAFPYVLNFGRLYATPNNGRYRVTGAKTIEIPTISTTGRVAADRDTIATATRNYDNAWEPKTLKNQRKWSTLVHPMDIDQTNMVASIQNITQVFNEEQKFPEMDAYLVSEVFKQWTALGKVADTTALTAANILSVFDKLMLNMDEALVPANGRILYCINAVKTLLKQAEGVVRQIEVDKRGEAVSRVINRLDEVEIIGVPSSLMKTAYDFTSGWKPTATAKQINMFLVHPLAVITPVSYQFAQLDAPSAVTEGKYIYFEESFEDVFILNKKADAVQFNVEADAGTPDSTLSSLTIGSLTLSPAFDADTTTYTAATTNATNKVTAVAADSKAVITITNNGTAVTNDSNVTWAAGTNTLVVKVVNGSESTTYTVTVTKS